MKTALKSEDAFPSGHLGALDNPIQLNEVEVTGKKPKSFLEKLELFITDEILLNRDNIRVKSYQKAESRNPNFSSNWDMASNITEGINVMSGGLLNRGSMSQNLGLVKDVINGNNFLESWFGNNGIVSDQFMNKHPILSTLVNTAADIVPILKYFKDSKILGKVVTPGLRALDFVGAPLNVRGNVKKIPVNGTPAGFSKNAFEYQLGLVIRDIRNGKIRPILNNLQESMNLWEQAQNKAILSHFPQNSLPLSPIVFPNTNTLLNTNKNEED